MFRSIRIRERIKLLARTAAYQPNAAARFVPSAFVGFARRRACTMLPYDASGCIAHAQADA